MRIVIVVGLDWHAKDLKQGLMGLGHEVTIVSTSTASSLGARVPMNTLLRLAEKFPVAKILTNPAFSYAARRKIDASRFDIAFIWSSYGIAFNNFEAFKIVVRGSTHIRTQYEILGRGKSLADRISILLEEYDYRLADRITVPSKFISEDQNWKEFKGKVNIAPYGCIPARLSSIQREIRGDFRGIFVGEFGFRKGADRILEFLAAQKGFDAFSVLGKNRSGVAILPEWWTVQGQVTNEQVQCSLDESEVLILLSREEGMARVGLEAISRGVPLIVSRETGLGFWTEKGCGVLISDPDSASEFFRAVDQIRQNQHRYALRCLEMSSSWTWENHAEEVLKNLPSLS